MKVFGMKEGEEPKFVEFPTPTVGIEKGEAILGRVLVNYKEWRWARAEEGNKYKGIAKHHFEAMLVAVDDFLNFTSQNNLSIGEGEEFRNFLQSLQK